VIFWGLYSYLKNEAAAFKIIRYRMAHLNDLA
jgi:hypothetical protein